MDKILLIDGNSVLFRAFYASNYGTMMKTSQGVETNAVYTFISMLMKALDTLQPTHLLVAFDSGVKSIRNDWYSEYKGTRKELDPSLVSQFPLVREYLDAAGILRYQSDGVEADDIIGTLCNHYPDDEVLILTSDKDLLQLIGNNISVYLMKTGLTDLVKVDEAELSRMYGLTPHQIIDLKSLMGDPSDNIPGVAGVGEKTALKLLGEYQTLENIYQNIDQIPGKLNEKLKTNKEMAFLSHRLATVIRDVDVKLDKSQLLLTINNNQLLHFYTKYEMKSLAGKLKIDQSDLGWKTIEKVNNLPQSVIDQRCALWIDSPNFQQDEDIFGIAVSTGDHTYYITIEDAVRDEAFIKLLDKDISKLVFDVKRWYHILQRYQLEANKLDDLMICAFLCDNSLNEWDKLLGKNQPNNWMLMCQFLQLFLVG